MIISYQLETFKNPYLQPWSFSQGSDFYIQLLVGHFYLDFSQALKIQDIQTEQIIFPS